MRCFCEQENITTDWLNTCYTAYNDTGFMYEKYNAFEVSFSFYKYKFFSLLSSFTLI